MANGGTNSDRLRRAAYLLDIVTAKQTQSLSRMTASTHKSMMALRFHTITCCRNRALSLFSGRLPLPFSS